MFETLPDPSGNLSAMTSLGLALFFLAILSTTAVVQGPNPRQRIRLDSDWRFRRNEEDKLGKSRFKWSYRLAPEIKSLDIQNLPADLSVGTWTDTAPGHHQFTVPFTFAWFRADLGSDPDDKGKILKFGGVDDNAVVFLNGKKLMVHKGWNEPFEMPVENAWREGQSNDLVVLVENENSNGGLVGSVRLDLPEKQEDPQEALPNFDDSNWRTVQIPHGYVVEGTFDPAEDTGHGSLPTPTAWYRKTFSVDAQDKGKTVYLEFDGIFRNATIWLNGHKLGRHPSGYIGVRFDITEHVKFGDINILAVHVDPRQFEGWWYEGGGIYRHVWLSVVNPVHIKPDGVFVKAVPNESAPGHAKLDFEAEIVNTLSESREVEVGLGLHGPTGKNLAVFLRKVIVPAGSSVKVSQPDMDFAPAQLWSIEQPSLYTLRVAINFAGKIVDRTDTSFGIRSIRFDPDKGFFLNGKPVKLKGTCNHQDHAGVGIAMPDSLQEWRIRKLKEMGSNAYRCSHNPPSKELLDACDRLGMLVMDETRHLGDTTLSKTPSGTKAADLTELRTMLLRDRNHPSIIMWSLFNEEPLQGTEEGANIFEAMKRLCNELDGTRPTTGAVNFGFGEGVVRVTDVYGFNYSIGQYEPIRAKFPKLPLLGSETASTVGTRGIYENDAKKGYVSAYDLNHPAWAETAEHAWKPIAERPWMAGGFVWTGFDYKGEPTPYGWPCINSHFGILDICGFPKDNYWYYKAWWGADPVVHILPHWTWPGKEGQNIDVWCHSNGDEVELFHNGKSLGKKKMPPYEHLEWKVPYEAGNLEARAYRDGKIIAIDKVETTGRPANIRLSVEPWVQFGPDDAYPVKVEVLDEQGRLVPDAANLVEFAVEGGQILGVGNGDPSSHEPDKASRRHAFNGLCMAIVQADGKAGKLTLTATSKGLKAAKLMLDVTAHKK